MSEWTEEHITAGLMAMIAWAGNASAASRYLKDHGPCPIAPGVLTGWKTIHAARYDELREKYSVQLEERLAHEMREVATEAVGVQRLALDKARQMLMENREADPARAAANAARVAQSNTDKLLALTGRPSQITETRGVQELVRSLAARGVIEIPQTTSEPT